MTITNSTFRDTDTVSPGNEGILLQADGTANITADFTGGSYLRNRANGIHVINNGSGNVNVDVGTLAAASGGTYDNNVGVNFANNGVGDFAFTIRNATIDGVGSAETACAGRSGSPININVGTASTIGALMSGTIEDNVATNNFSSKRPAPTTARRVSGPSRTARRPSV